MILNTIETARQANAIETLIGRLPHNTFTETQMDSFQKAILAWKKRSKKNGDPSIRDIGRILRCVDPSMLPKQDAVYYSAAKAAMKSLQKYCLSIIVHELYDTASVASDCMGCKSIRLGMEKTMEAAANATNWMDRPWDSAQASLAITPCIVEAVMHFNAVTIDASASDEEKHIASSLARYAGDAYKAMEAIAADI